MKILFLLAAIIMFVLACFTGTPHWLIPAGLAAFAASFLPVSS